MIRRIAMGFVAGMCLACGGSPPPPSQPPPAPKTTQTASVPTAPSPDRSSLPKPEPIAPFAPPSPQRFDLSNGIKVWFLQHGKLPIVSSLLVLPRGAASEPAAKAGLTELMVDLLDEGAGKRSALELSEELQRLATDYYTEVDVDYVLLGMESLTENFAPSMDLLADIAMRPKFDLKEFKRRKDQLIANALSNEAQPRVARSLAVRHVLFGDGYAGTPVQGTRSTLTKVTHHDVKKQFRDLVVPEGAQFVVVGGIDQATVKAELDRVFGGWKGKANVKPRDVVPQAESTGIYLIDYPGAEQSVVGLARRATGANAKDYFPSLVFNRSFGEAFTSRLNLNLRESKGYTYGATSAFLRYRDAGYFGLFADVKSDVTRPSIDEMLKELSGACGTRSFTQAERDESVSGLLLGFPSKFERVNSVALRFSALPIYNRPPDWYQKWPVNVKGISTEAMNMVAKTYCDPKQFAIVIAGDYDKLKSQLGTLERPIRRYTAQGRPAK